MESLVDVVIGDTVDFDRVIYECWLDGASLKSALSLKMNGPKLAAPGRKASTTGGGMGSPKIANAPTTAPVVDAEDVASSVWAANPQAVELLQMEICDQYRTYDILGHYIRSPHLLGEQTIVLMDEAAQNFVIQKYFELDDAVVREILARKLAKNRKDLDEVSEIVKMSLRRVTR